MLAGMKWHTGGPFMRKSRLRQAVPGTGSARLPLWILVIVVCVAAIPAFCGQRETVATERIVLPHLRRPVEILIDHWGVPHIYAKNEADLFLAQGFNVARDRLFQIDLWYRRGLGQLAEVFGPSYAEQDKATRLFVYRGAMKKEWEVYGPGTEEMFQQFTAGINAYVDWVDAHPDQMPFEFKYLHYKPAHWTAEGAVRIRSYAYAYNLEEEVARAKVACAADLKSEELRFKLEPPWQTRIPDGLDPCLPKNVLKVYDLATRAVSFTPESLKSDVNQLFPRTMQVWGAEFSGESNNWVIAGKKSASGHAILASDPHLEYIQPSVRYLLDLNAPTLHVAGANRPISPGVSLGHNDWIGFAHTSFPVDQEDLYVYELNPANPDQYKYQGQWESFRVVREEIKVKDRSAIGVDLKFTRHGPVIYVEKEKNRAFAVRSVWLEPGTSPYYPSYEHMRSRTFGDYKKSVERWGTPSLNHVYADVQGNIGWAPRGFAPIRPNWDGLLPVPGDGRYEWTGHLTGDQFPTSYNPPSGYITTSNEMNLPHDYPYKDRKLGFEWGVPFRHQRIDEVLSELTKVSVEDSMRLQNDVVSIPARRLLALLQLLSSDDATTKAALTLLKGWNASEDADSPQAALYEVWFSRYLRGAFKQAVLSKAAADSFEFPDAAALLDALENPETRFTGNPAQERDHLLLTTLASAYEEMGNLQGSDPRQWAWGKLHHNLSQHPLSAIVDEATRAKLNVGPLERSGGPYTPNVAHYRVTDFRDTDGPSIRIVVDLGNWDNSRAVNYPGQSGDPDSPHYRDLAPLWRTGQYVPLLYTRKAVEAATEKRFELVPKLTRP
jgi:penicillin G amidase